ncbi:MAG: hypothetical protein KC493_03920 [Bacteriovoracaceae bacterium]|nr:hypothetical protein [Bacteriovoracaceae bacterium]
MQNLIEKAKSILELNDRGKFTIPSAPLYPHMSAWDSAFVAMGWAHINLDRSLDELEFLLSSGLENGMVPHITFDKSQLDGYFPGPEVWNNENSSTLARPTNCAIALEYIANRGANEERIKALLPAIEKSHLFFHENRDPLKVNQVALLHPWESSMDNAPCWDSPMRRISSQVEIKLDRFDTKQIPDIGQLPTDEQYLKYLRIIETLSKNDYEPQEFLVYDPMMTTVLALNENALARLSSRFHFDSNANVRAKSLEKSLLKEWDKSQSRCPYLDALIEMNYFVPTLGSLFPAILENASEDIKKDAIGTLKEKYINEYGLSTFDMTSDMYDSKSFSRGPCWVDKNWFFSNLLSDEMKDLTLKLVKKSGFREYYHPESGKGLGADNFSSSAALFLFLYD